MIEHLDGRSVNLSDRIERGYGEARDMALFIPSAKIMDWLENNGECQSAVGFAFCHLLCFELAPRLKAIARQKLALQSAGMRRQLPNLLPILSGVIDWGEIERQYDEMVKTQPPCGMGRRTQRPSCDGLCDRM